MADYQNVADEEFSLRDSDILYPYARNQGHMNVCYTYSSTEAIAALYAREMSKPPIELSTQQLVDHVPIVYEYEKKGHSRDDVGCYFGSHMDCFKYAMHTPLCLDRDYPRRTSRWEADIVNPIPNKNEKYLIGNYERVDANNEEEINDALKYQPMVGAIRFFPSFGKSKGQGVYMGGFPCELDLGGHSILIVGYGIQDGIKYYLIKNSAGEKWGVQGYGKVKRDLIYSLAYPTSVYKYTKVDDIPSTSGIKKNKGRR